MQSSRRSEVTLLLIHGPNSTSRVALAYTDREEGNFVSAAGTVKKEVRRIDGQTGQAARGQDRHIIFRICFHVGFLQVLVEIESPTVSLCRPFDTLFSFVRVPLVMFTTDGMLPKNLARQQDNSSSELEGPSKSHARLQPGGQMQRLRKADLDFACNSGLVG